VTGGTTDTEGHRERLRTTVTAKKVSLRSHIHIDIYISYGFLTEY
jgi:hypothetical protein